MGFPIRRKKATATLKDGGNLGAYMKKRARARFPKKKGSRTSLKTARAAGMGQQRPHALEMDQRPLMRTWRGLPLKKGEIAEISLLNGIRHTMSGCRGKT